MSTSAPIEFATVDADQVQVGDVVLGFTTDKYHVMRGGPLVVGSRTITDSGSIRLGPQMPSNRSARFFSPGESVRIATAARWLREASLAARQADLEANRIRQEAEERAGRIKKVADAAFDNAVDLYVAAGGTDWRAVMHQARETPSV